MGCPGRSVKMCLDKSAALNTDRRATQTTDLSPNTRISKSAALFKIVLRRRFLERCATVCPARSVSKFPSPRLSINLKLVVLLYMRRGVQRFLGRLVTITPLESICIEFYVMFYAYN